VLGTTYCDLFNKRGPCSMCWAPHMHSYFPKLLKALVAQRVNNTHCLMRHLWHSV